MSQFKCGLNGCGVDVGVTPPTCHRSLWNLLQDRTRVALNAHKSTEVCLYEEGSSQSSCLIPFCCAEWMEWKASGRHGATDVIAADTDRQIDQHLKAANSQTSSDGGQKNAESVGFMIKLNPHNDAFVLRDADCRTQSKQSALIQPPKYRCF